jgi:hypothetical protein
MDEQTTFPDELIEQLFPGGFTLRDEANAIVACAMRNGPLEDLHAGKHSSLLEDDSLSRITDAEMKQLMLHACEEIEALLRLKEGEPKKYDAMIKGALIKKDRAYTVLNLFWIGVGLVGMLRAAGLA